MNNSEEGLGCSSGAVVGELIAEAHKRYNNQGELEQDLAVKEAQIKKLLGLEGVDSLDNLTEAQKQILIENLEVLDHVQATQNKLLELKKEGVGLARLGAGLAELIAGGEVNVGSQYLITLAEIECKGSSVPLVDVVSGGWSYSYPMITLVIVMPI